MNFKEKSKGISNYDDFRNQLIVYLKEYPVISFTEFKKFGQDLYNKSEFEFDYSDNFFSNLYYNWRKNSNVYTKYSLFENQMSIGGNHYLRDFALVLIYNKNNKSLFKHEQAIFISDYFIRKMRKSTHCYIDGTFVYPKGFKQLIVILY